jgi:hypothetical protein
MEAQAAHRPLGSSGPGTSCCGPSRSAIRACGR